MIEFTKTVEIPVLSGTATIILDGRATTVMKNDVIIVNYDTKVDWWMKWLIKSSVIERRVSVWDEDQRRLHLTANDESSLRNASIE